MITYNDIYEAARNERYSDQLQPIPKNFVVEFASYLREKKEKIPSEAGEFSDVSLKVNKQLENASTFFKEIVLRRRKKILNLVLIAAETGISKQDFSNMLAFEKDFFEELMKCMDSSDNKLNNLLNGKQKKSNKNNELIVFKEDVASFMGLNAEKMGPFKEGEIANLPKDISKILIEGNKAERII